MTLTFCPAFMMLHVYGIIRGVAGKNLSPPFPPASQLVRDTPMATVVEKTVRGILKHFPPHTNPNDQANRGLLQIKSVNGVETYDDFIVESCRFFFTCWLKTACSSQI